MVSLTFVVVARELWWGDGVLDVWIVDRSISVVGSVLNLALVQKYKVPFVALTKSIWTWIQGAAALQSEQSMPRDSTQATQV